MGDNPIHYGPWTRVHAFKVQAHHPRTPPVSGYAMAVNDPELFARFLSVSALRRLGD